MRHLRHAVILGPLLLGLAASTAVAADRPLRMTVSPSGEVELTLDGARVASGRWALRADSYLPGDRPDSIMPGPVLGAVGLQDRPGHATVHQTSDAATADFTFDLAGEDLGVAVHVVNHDPAHQLRPVAFTGPRFHFNPAVPVAGELSTWFFTYLQAQGTNIFHPSVASPVGCWWGADDRFAFSIFSASEFDHAFLVTAEYGGRDGVIAAECQPDLFTDRVVPAGRSVDITWSIRITTDRSVPHLIAPYRPAYARHFPLPMYTPDSRGMASFTEADQQHITRSNPFGYHSAGCRFDTAAGTASYVRRYAVQERRAGLAGHIFWSPGGYTPPMYPPDFDVFPPAVQANIPALVRGFHDQGIRVGLCARPGDGVVRRAGEAPVVYRLSADNPGDMRVLADRFRHALAMGFDVFYLDSIGGGGVNDVRIIRHIRDTVGPGVLLYSEYCTDMELPYAGRYCEWAGRDGIFWTSANARAALRLLCPDAPWIGKSRTRDPNPHEFADLGLAPLVLDQDVRRLAFSPIEP